MKKPLITRNPFVHDFCSPESELLENMWVHMVNVSSSKDIQFCLHVRETLPHGVAQACMFNMMSKPKQNATVACGHGCLVT